MAAAAMKDDLCAVIHADRKKLYADTSFVDSVRRLLEKEYDFRDWKKPDLAQYLLGAAARHPKSVLDSFDVFQAAVCIVYILYILRLYFAICFVYLLYSDSPRREAPPRTCHETLATHSQWH